MDKMTHYRTLIEQILKGHAELVSSQPEPELETLLSFDDEHDQYLWIQSGWQNNERVHGVTVHIRLHNNKIWIEEDWTENGIAQELIEYGVSSEDIVLAFHHPDLRSSTEFALA